MPIRVDTLKWLPNICLHVEIFRCYTCPLNFGCWLRSCDFPWAEKGRTACKAEQIHKMTTIFTQKDNLGLFWGKFTSGSKPVLISALHRNDPFLRNKYHVPISKCFQLFQRSPMHFFASYCWRTKKKSKPLKAKST